MVKVMNNLEKLAKFGGILGEIHCYLQNFEVY